MLSKKTVLILAGILLLTVNLIMLAVTTRRPAASGLGRAMIAFVAPFQELATRAVKTIQDGWWNYFFLVSVSQENQRLLKELGKSHQKIIQQSELELENQRLRELLGFKRSLPAPAIAAEIIGKDPSAWFKTVIIDKGSSDGLRRGLPAVSSLGVVGQIVEVSGRQSRLMLIIDRNSGADALVQRTRARGVVKGTSRDECYLDYVLHADDVRVGDLVVSSGFDGVYPKGLLIGTVTAVDFKGGDFFKDVQITPAVDFDKLEEVLIILESPPASAGVH
ncbi:MAG: rod shape-determining protein MreC [Desulfobacterales bacterium]|jgi:rod shape-determining protein MreC|nr:rod shape-determining protein MreC [Desulfobacterales bacterium]